MERLTDSYEQLKDKCYSVQEENRMQQSKIDTLERFNTLYSPSFFFSPHIVQSLHSNQLNLFHICASLECFTNSFKKFYLYLNYGADGV